MRWRVLLLIAHIQINAAPGVFAGLQVLGSHGSAVDLHTHGAAFLNVNILQSHFGPRAKGKDTGLSLSMTNDV